MFCEQILRLPYAHIRFKADATEKREYFDPANPTQKKPCEIGKHDCSESYSQSICKLHVLHLGKDTGSNQGEGSGDRNAESFQKKP
jgi:hypothetical protein